MHTVVTGLIDKVKIEGRKRILRTAWERSSDYGIQQADVALLNTIDQKIGGFEYGFVSGVTVETI